MSTLTKTGKFAFTNFAGGWSPNITPQNSDTLIANTGFVLQIGGQLPDTTLDLGSAFDTNGALPPPVFDIVFGHIGTVDVTTQTPDLAGAQINVFGSSRIDKLTLGVSFAGDRATVNIEPFSKLTTTINGGSRSVLQVNGGTGAALDNEGSSTINFATIAANVVGSGSWSDSGFGHLSFLGRVASSQSVDLGGNAGMTIQHPDTFGADITLEEGWGSGVGNLIFLAGIHGDSWTYRNDILTISDAGKAVDQLRIHDVGAEAFSVSDTGAGAVLFGNFGPPGNFQQQFSGVIAPAPA